MAKHNKTIYMVQTIQVATTYWTASDFTKKIHNADYSDYVSSSGTFTKYSTTANAIMPKLYPSQIESAQIPSNATITSLDYNIIWSLEKNGSIAWTAKQGFETYTSIANGKKAPNDAGNGTLTGTSKETKTFSFNATNSLASTGSSLTIAFKNNNVASNHIRIYRCDCTLHYTLPDITYTYKDWNGIVLKTQTVEEGTSPTPPSDPTRAADAQYTYTFSGWSLSGTTYTAQYTTTKRSYTITVNADNNGTATGSGTYEYGSTVSLIATPNSELYKFKQWNDGNTNNPRTITVTGTATYTAQFERTVYIRTWNYNGGRYQAKESLSQQIAADGVATGLIQFQPIKKGYHFIGWNESKENGYITQDGFKGYTNNRSLGWEVTENEDYSTKYKFVIKDISANTWKSIKFGYYNAKPNDTIVVHGYIRLISAPCTLNFYHGEKDNDYANNKMRLNANNVSDEWQYFEIINNSYSTTTSTACFELYTSNLLDLPESTLEFDLKEIEIYRVIEDRTENLLSLKMKPLQADVTITALYRPAAYLSYDTILNYTKWKEVDGIAANNNGTLSSVGDYGFTLTSNEGVAEGLVYSPFFSVSAGVSYKIDIDIAGTDWDVYIFFCDKDGNWIDFADSTNRFSSNGTGVTTHIFTAPQNEKVVKAQIRCDANNSNNTVTFSNFRIYPAEMSYMKNTIQFSKDRTRVIDDSEDFYSPIPYRVGYTFKGWGKKPESPDNLCTSDEMANACEDQIYYSQWEKNTSSLPIYIGSSQMDAVYIGDSKDIDIYIGLSSITN